MTHPQHGAECLKYWTAGFQAGKVERAVIFFHGDVWIGEGRTNKRYLDMTNAKLQRDADDWARQIGAPYIFFARPGTHGSSGQHMERRRPAESLLISAAMDQLKVKFGIKEWVLAGQSGGGHVTASLVTHRADIVCAIPTSSPSSPRVRWQTRGWQRDSTGFADSYEPTEHLHKVKVHSNLRVFVLGDPKDRNVVWPSQTVMTIKAREAGVAATTLEGEGSGPDRHGLSNSSRNVAGWCARNKSTDEIVREAAGRLKG